MVLPLKLTQFYGHSVPRPRVYPDVKFNDHRVDPPVPVNDALLSWAQDAHWSMGGLSFKRLRMQGKIEGSVRKLRAQLEKLDEEEEEEDDVALDLKKKQQRPIADEKQEKAEKRQHAGDGAQARSDLVEATPARKRDRVAQAEGSQRNSPSQPKRRDVVEATPVRKRKWRETEEAAHKGEEFVPATVERKRHKSSSKPRGASSESGDGDGDDCVGTQSPSTRKAGKKSFVDRSPEFVPSTVEKKGRSASGKKSKSVLLSSSSDEDEDVAVAAAAAGSRGLRSAQKAVAAVDPVVAGRTTKMKKIGVAKKPPAARKVLLRHADGDESSSDSDDGLEEFLDQKDRPVRRSSRLHHSSPSSHTEHSDSESD